MQNAGWAGVFLPSRSLTPDMKPIEVSDCHCFGGSFRSCIARR